MFTWDCETLEERGLSETLKDNEWTVVLRLLVSTGDTNQLAARLEAIDLAQPLYDLRVSSRKDYTAIRTLASALGVDDLGVYSIVEYEQVVEFAFEAPLSEQQETEMWKIATVLLALIEDADQINYSFPTADGSKRFTYYCGLEQPDSWVRSIGYDEIKAMGQSIQGVRELLALLDSINRNTLPGDLFSTLSKQQPLRAFMDLLVTETWGALPGDVTAYGMPVENGALTVHFENAPTDPGGFDAYLAKAALVLMYVKPEVTEVCWSYPGGGGENTERRVRWEDRAIITSLFSNYEASSTYPVTSQEELERLLAYVNLDDKMYRLWIESSSGTDSPMLTEGAEPFDDIMGYSGFSLVTFDSGFWQERTYYAVADTGTFPVAESFGFVGPRDYAVDLDGDGVTELVCNVQFGGDGAARVYVYQRRADGIFRGCLDTEDLPGHVDWSVNSVWEEYDPAKNVFRIHYAVEGQDDYAVLETHGLERVRYEKYEL